eukprot:359138-Chlamydomonas_euryale.AAC.9
MRRITFIPQLKTPWSHSSERLHPTAQSTSHKFDDTDPTLYNAIPKNCIMTLFSTVETSLTTDLNKPAWRASLSPQ